MRLILNIRGTNGSGKSSIVMSMLDDPNMYVISKPYQGRSRNIATVFPQYGWVALGTYFNKTGGMDCFPNNELTKKAFWYVLKKFPQYNLVMEGIISSTIFSTYETLFKEAQEKYPDTKVVVLRLAPPVEVCLQRIQKRNGGKPIKEKLVSDKYHMIERACNKFKAAGIRMIIWDNTKPIPEKTKKISPLYEILKRCEEGYDEEI